MSASPTAASSSSSSPITLQGALRKAYEDFVLGKGSLSQQQIDELKKVTHLPDEFLNGDKDERFKKITAIDLSMFVSVVEIGTWFLYECSALTSADLSALTSVSIIGEGFLCKCSAMTSVTLPSASKITKIDKGFLGGCESLTAIHNMQALSNVTSIDERFLNGCSSLETVDFRPLSNVKSVGCLFLCNCPKLTKKEYLDQVDLTPLLHLSDNAIKVHPNEGNNNLKVALARVRAGGANGLKYFIAKLKEDLQLASQDTIDFLVKQAINDDQIFLRLEADHLASVPLGDRMKLLDEIKRRKAANSSSSTSSPTAASQSSSSSSSACQNCKKLEAQFSDDKKKLESKLDCSEKENANLKQEKEGEKQQHLQILNKQADRLREFSNQKDKLEADLEDCKEYERKLCEDKQKLEADNTSLKDENTRHLEKLRDQANLLQDLKQKQEASSGVAPAPEENQQQAEIKKMDEDDLGSFLKSRGVASKILSILKDEGVAGREFLHQRFLEENEDLFGSVRKTAFETFKELHAELSAAAGTGKGTSSTTTSATAASN